MTRDCDRCETPTDSETWVVNGSVFRLCDTCRVDFNRMLSSWLDGPDENDKPALRADCEHCGGEVEAELRNCGGRIDFILRCSECDYSGRVEGGL